MWYSPDANVRLHAEPAFGVVPGIPSLIVTANRVDQFLSNTGSFSGSFTGNLIGTASTASFYQETDPVFVAKSASLATTGSNNFNGNQTITGSLIHGLAGNIATGEDSHAEGSITKAIGNYSHAEGDNTQAKGDYSHAEGQETIASGSYSHAEGYGTIALGDRQHVTGQYNFVSPVQSAFIVGNGTDDGNRSNLIYAHDSTVEITGSLEVNGGITGSLFGTATTASYISGSVFTSTNPALSASYALTASYVLPSPSAGLIYFMTGSPASISAGTGSEQVLTSITIPANTVQVGDRLEIFYSFSKVGTNAVSSYRIKISGSGTDGTLLNNGANQGATVLGLTSQNLYRVLSTSSMVGSSQFFGGVATVGTTINYTGSSLTGSNTFYFNAVRNSLSDTITLNDCYIKILR
jgi:hypothetical protein